MRTPVIQRAVVTIATAALLLIGVGLTVAAGMTLRSDPPDPILSDRPIEAAIVTSTPPAPAPVVTPESPPPAPERTVPGPRYYAAPPVPEEPKAEAKPPVRGGDSVKGDEDDKDDEDDHETVKPPVRDDEEDDEHDVIDKNAMDVKD